MNPNQFEHYQDIKKVLVLQRSSRYMAQSNKTQPHNNLTKNHYIIQSSAKLNIFLHTNVQ